MRLWRKKESQNWKDHRTEAVVPVRDTKAGKNLETQEAAEMGISRRK